MQFKYIHRQAAKHPCAITVPCAKTEGSCLATNSVPGQALTKQYLTWSACRTANCSALIMAYAHTNKGFCRTAVSHTAVHAAYRGPCSSPSMLLSSVLADTVESLFLCVGIWLKSIISTAPDDTGLAAFLRANMPVKVELTEAPNLPRPLTTVFLGCG